MSNGVESTSSHPTSGTRLEAGGGEKRLAFIHRVIVSGEECPKEFAVLVTDRRSIFIRQEKTRSAWVLRSEMRYGTALVTDVAPKTLEDFGYADFESLATAEANISVPHEAVLSLRLGSEAPEPLRRDFFVRLTMKRQGETFQVYHLEMRYREGRGAQSEIRFYLVPLGAYFKPRRQTQGRETILREYAMDALATFERVLPASSILR